MGSTLTTMEHNAHHKNGKIIYCIQLDVSNIPICLITQSFVHTYNHTVDRQRLRPSPLLPSFLVGIIVVYMKLPFSLSQPHKPSPITLHLRQARFTK